MQQRMQRMAQEAQKQAEKQQKWEDENHQKMMAQVNKSIRNFDDSERDSLGPPTRQAPMIEDAKSTGRPYSRSDSKPGWERVVTMDPSVTEFPHLQLQGELFVRVFSFDPETSSRQKKGTLGSFDIPFEHLSTLTHSATRVHIRDPRLSIH